MGAGAALLVLLGGCLGGDGGDQPTAPAADTDCEPQAEAVPTGDLLEGARGWAFGEAPVYVSFLEVPAYRGGDSFVPIDPASERNGRYAVKMMTIIHPRFSGRVRQEVSAVTEARAAAFGLGSSSSAAVDELPTTRSFLVRRRDDLIPGQLVFSGPGCYRLALEADGRHIEFAFPVRFSRS